MLQIASARWSDGPEPRVLVSGDWSLGISTPPTCDLLEGANGVSGWYDPYSGMSIDGGSFSREFVAARDRSPAPRQDVEYRVRCEISQDTGRTIEATAPVQGSPPAP